MSVNIKHMATFLLGAAAAFGAYKYSKLSDEEKEKLIATLKEHFPGMEEFLGRFFKKEPATPAPTEPAATTSTATP